MQSDSQSREIDGFKFEVFMLPPKKAQRILIDMVKVAGPTLASLVTETRKTSGSILDAQIDFGKLAAELVSKLDKDVLEGHQEMFAGVTQVNGAPLKPIFDIQFQGRLMQMFKWHQFAIEANFSDFSDALGTVFKRVPKVESPTPE